MVFQLYIKIENKIDLFDVPTKAIKIFINFFQKWEEAIGIFFSGPQILHAHSWQQPSVTT